MRTLTCCILLAAGACSDSTSPRDRQAIRRFVTVAPATQLETLDYGGSGPPLVLLAGLGNSAHVFASFAPRLTSTYRVIAITRRGFGASTQPGSGYDTRTLAEDVRIVLDSLRLTSVHIVGHSLAGDEMNRLARDHADRIRSLVYLDAAYDRLALGALIDANPFPDAPAPDLVDLITPVTFGRYIARVRGVSLPDEEIRATYRFGTAGVEGEVTPPDVYQALFAGIEGPDWPRVRVPALAIYAVPEDAGDVLPWLNVSSPGWQTAQQLIRGVYIPFYREQRQQFRTLVNGSRVLELPGANHYVFLSHGARVAQAIRDFLGA